MRRQDASTDVKVETTRAPRRRRRAEAIVAQYIHEISGRDRRARRRIAIAEAR